MTTMQSILHTLKEAAPDYHEAMLINAPRIDAADSDVESLLRGWACLFGHTLRERGNPFRWISHDEAVEWIKVHLTHDLVFATPGMDEQQALDLTMQLLGPMGQVKAVASDFTISDWTFCDLLIVSNESTTLLLAFLGED